MPSLIEIFFWWWITALATGIWALPFWWLGKSQVSEKYHSILEIIAGGLMLVMSIFLILDGIQESILGLVGGVVMGGVFVLASHAILRGNHPEEMIQSGIRNSRHAFLLIGVMTLHSLAEGIAVWVGFWQWHEFGVFLALGMAIHNIPEGIVITSAVVSRGGSIFEWACWSIFSSLPQPIFAVPAFFFVSWFSLFLPWGLGFAAGAMIGVCALDIWPSCQREMGRGRGILLVGLIILATLALGQASHMIGQ